VDAAKISEGLQLVLARKAYCVVCARTFGISDRDPKGETIKQNFDKLISAGKNATRNGTWLVSVTISILRARLKTIT
jgi:hypothetical protein